MSAHAATAGSLEDPGPLVAPRLRLAANVMAAVGLATFGVLLLDEDKSRAWEAFLLGMMIPTFIGLGGLFFVAAHSVGSAVWVVPLRRLIEGLSSGLWVTWWAFLIMALVGSHWLYDWVNLSGTEVHERLFHIPDGSKAAFMTWPRFLVMNLAIIAAWLALRHRLVGLSLRQDTVGGSIRDSHRRLSIITLIVFALSVTLFVWDLLLSLHVNWFSTMWGVYCFTSMVQSFLCVLILFVLWLRRGPLHHHVPRHIMHDLGTWMVAWSCFCAYIGFSQYMLIYYANLDEETFYYVLRTQNGYGLHYAIEAIIRWPLPFLGLMSQRVRTDPRFLLVICSVVLIGNWLDWGWIILPAFSMNEYRSPFAWQELLVGIGFAGAFLATVLRFWARNGLVARRDPELLTAVNAEHLH